MQNAVRRKPLVAEVIGDGSLQVLSVPGQSTARGIVPRECRQRSQKCQAVVEKLLAKTESGLIRSINADAHDPAALARRPYGVLEVGDLARAFDGDVDATAVDLDGSPEVLLGARVVDAGRAKALSQFAPAFEA